MAATNKKRIVLTGATRGLGRVLVDRFAEGGHTVIGCGRDKAAIDALNRSYSAPHNFAVVDVSRADQVEAWAARILKDHGAPDLLINNAAIINRNATLWQVPAEEFDRVIDVNIKGIANVIRSFVPAMVAKRSGVIVNLSSGWGRSTSPEVAPYCATKWAVEGLTRALAQELPKGMAAVPLDPGIIDTDMLRSAFGEAAGGYSKTTDWSAKAAPMLLGLGPKDNGQPLSVPK
jgi:NAD(P)-dependent dehydrogenase (short-subunit alcohol dehydrogenase family)